MDFLRQNADYPRRFGDLSFFVTECLLEVAALSNVWFWGLWWDINELTLGLNVGAGYEGGEEGNYGKERQGRWGDGTEYKWMI